MVSSRGHSLIAECGLLTAGASLFAERRLSDTQVSVVVPTGSVALLYMRS